MNGLKTIAIPMQNATNAKKTITGGKINKLSPKITKTKTAKNTSKAGSSTNGLSSSKYGLYVFIIIINQTQYLFALEAVLFQQ